MVYQEYVVLCLPGSSADGSRNGETRQVEKSDGHADSSGDPRDLGIIDDLTVPERDVKVIRLRGEQEM